VQIENGLVSGDTIFPLLEDDHATGSDRSGGRQVRSRASIFNILTGRSSVGYVKFHGGDSVPLGLVVPANDEGDTINCSPIWNDLASIDSFFSLLEDDLHQVLEIPTIRTIIGHF
jgi:hypothetical protein